MHMQLSVGQWVSKRGTISASQHRVPKVCSVFLKEVRWTDETTEWCSCEKPIWNVKYETYILMAKTKTTKTDQADVVNMRLWRQERQPTWTLDSCHKASAVLLFPVHTDRCALWKVRVFSLVFWKPGDIPFFTIWPSGRDNREHVSKYQAEHIWIIFRPETLYKNTSTCMQTQVCIH